MLKGNARKHFAMSCFGEYNDEPVIFYFEGNLVARYPEHPQSKNFLISEKDDIPGFKCEDKILYIMKMYSVDFHARDNTEYWRKLAKYAYHLLNGQVLFTLD